MPYVNKLNVRGTQFDIRDEEARTEIEALKKKIAQLDNPNSRFELKYTGIVLASDTDVTNFVNSYNPTNNYGDLAVGNIITIQDGTYNKDWIIAGFDMYEYPSITDNTISLLPLMPLELHTIDEPDLATNMYIGSNLYTVTLKNINEKLTANITNLLTFIHNNYSSAGGWSSPVTVAGYSTLGTAAAGVSQINITLMSEIQILGNHTLSNMYDSGYNQSQFPLFHHMLLQMLPQYMKYYCSNSINNLENLPSYKEDDIFYHNMLGSPMVHVGLRDITLGNSNIGFLTWNVMSGFWDIDQIVKENGDQMYLFPEINIPCYVTGFAY